MPEPKIRKVSTIEEYRQCEKLQQEIWGFEDIAVIPDHLMITAQHHGGLLLGAFVGEEMVGFALSLLGKEGRRLKHSSMQVGVKQSVRHQGLGFRLKQRQRDYVMSQDIDLMTWTFDPLQSRNAYFNFHKLGVVSNTYEENYYGDIRDELNKGTITDRFLVHWWISSPRVAARTDGRRQKRRPSIDSGYRVNETERENSGFLRCRNCDLNLNSETVFVQIPRDINDIREHAPELATEWRHKTREIFKEYLQRGYWVSDVLNEDGATFYRLRQSDKETLLEGEQ